VNCNISNSCAPELICELTTPTFTPHDRKARVAGSVSAALAQFQSTGAKHLAASEALAQALLEAGDQFVVDGSASKDGEVGGFWRGEGKSMSAKSKGRTGVVERVRLRATSLLPTQPTFPQPSLRTTASVHQSPRVHLGKKGLVFLRHLNQIDHFQTASRASRRPRQRQKVGTACIARFRTGFHS
jgi:hypothetical protein